MAVKTIAAQAQVRKEIDLQVRQMNADGRKISFMGGLSRDLSKTYFDSNAARRSVESLRRAGVLKK